jgi:catechol 2,3-dioxygenase-like lactoylglutathione lyase family enzyme
MSSILPHRAGAAKPAGPTEPSGIEEGVMTERLIIVDHVLFVVEDFPASRRLYTAALAPLGIEELNEEPNCISYGRQDLDDFSICEGSPVTTASHVAFDAADRSQVDAFFEAAVAAGATTRGEPGVWIQYSNRYYAAFVDDLHGNNVEAVWHAPEPVMDAPTREFVP